MQTDETVVDRRIVVLEILKLRCMLRGHQYRTVLDPSPAWCGRVASVKSAFKYVPEYSAEHFEYALSDVRIEEGRFLEGVRYL